MENQCPILIAEDDDSEALLIKRAIHKAGFNNPFHISSDREQTRDYLRGTGEFADRARFPFPRILLIDLNTPRLTHFPLLVWLKQHPNCRVTPTVVLTSSAMPSDVERAYQLGANAFLVKPVHFEHLVRLFKLTLEFWQICEKPPPQHHCS